ncbi:MAG: hypothetical protein HQ503_05405 [Rhodospirillales bacterium]|nr:hypothetical protein [Rhodospirillales bacterium]
MIGTIKELNLKNLRQLVRPLSAFAAAAVIFAGIMATSDTARAQGAGIDRAIVVKELAEKHEEQPVGMGVTAGGGVIELFSREDGGTWTLILTMPSGKSYVLGEGKDWAGLPAFVKGHNI